MYVLGYLHDTRFVSEGVPTMQVAARSFISTTLTTGAPRISVLEPCASNICVFLIYAELDVRDPLSESNACKNSRDTSANDDYSQWTSFINRPILHNPLWDLTTRLLSLLG